jgi:hypothetical protein
MAETSVISLEVHQDCPHTAVSLAHLPEKEEQAKVKVVPTTKMEEPRRKKTGSKRSRKRSPRKKARPYYY